ncbi:MAG: hypothetical protein IJT21_06705 [Synergistaceae bacterium]|nr:hypothetical protein [Synergistaceae bacterium]
MFLNVTNHNSSMWQQKLIEAASVYGEIVDYPFPKIEADYTEEDISQIARETVSRIIAMNPTACMVAGEFSLTFQIVEGLLNAGIKVVITCSERKTIEHKNPDGTLTKTADFDFVKFREYEHFKS